MPPSRHQPLLRTVVLTALLTLGACSGRDDGPAEGSGNVAGSGDTPGDVFAEGETSMPGAVEPLTPSPGVPGGDTTLIEGLWDASVFQAGVRIDERYVSITLDGTWTLFDYDADQAGSSEQRNCFLVDGPLTLTPEGGDAYSLPARTVFATRKGDFLSVRFGDEVDEQSWPLDRTRSADGFERCTDA